MAGAGWRQWLTGDALTLSRVQNNLQDQVVMVYATESALTSGVTEAEGMVAYISDSNRVAAYNGTGWHDIAGGRSVWFGSSTAAGGASNTGIGSATGDTRFRYDGFDGGDEKVDLYVNGDLSFSFWENGRLDITGDGSGTGTAEIRFNENNPTDNAAEDVYRIVADSRDLLIQASTDNWSSAINRFSIENYNGDIKLYDDSGSAVVTVDAASTPARVGINDTTPGYTLDVTGTGRFTSTFYTNAAILGRTGTAGAPTYAFESYTTDGFFRATGGIGVTISGTQYYEFGSTTLKPTVAGTDLGTSASSTERYDTIYAVNALNTSDERLKTRTGPALGLDFVDRLTPFAGRWREEAPTKSTDIHQFVGAQDVYSTLLAVGLDPHEHHLWAEGEDGTQSVSHNELTIVNTQAIKELYELVRDLRARIDKE